MIQSTGMPFTSPLLKKVWNDLFNAQYWGGMMLQVEKVAFRDLAEATSVSVSTLALGGSTHHLQ